jgi:hypothetical protein
VRQHDAALPLRDMSRNSKAATCRRTPKKASFSRGAAYEQPKYLFSLFFYGILLPSRPYFAILRGHGELFKRNLIPQ